MKRFFRVLFVTLGIIFSILIVLSIFLLLNISSLTQEKEVALKEDQILKIDLNKPVSEGPVDEIAKIFKKGCKYNFISLLESIKQAKEYDEIKGIYLKIGGGALGWAQAEELRKAIEDFKQSGKKVWVFFEFAGDLEYTLASVGDEIYASPNSVALLDGLSARIMFYKKTLKKIGIEFETVRHGKFKSAIEPFVREDISDENRLMMKGLLNSLSDHYIQAIKELRGLEDVDAIVQNGPYFIASDLKKLNLVDELVPEYKIYHEDRFKKDDLISLEDFLKVPEKRELDKKNKIAVVIAEGEITNGKRKEGNITDKGLIEDLKKAFKNDRVKAIVLRVNSPGGSGSASDNIWSFIEEHKKDKPIVVSMGNVAASGGYYIAMNSNRILANASTLTGSIGVFFLRPIFGGLYDKIGLNVETIKTHENADFLYSERRLTEPQKAKMKRFIEEFYDVFTSKAAQGRGKTQEEVDEVGQGRVWTGEQFIQYGMVDEIGGLFDAIESAKKLAEIPEESIPALVVYPKPKTIVERIMEENFLASSKWVKIIMGLEEDLKPQGKIEMMLPYKIEIH